MRIAGQCRFLQGNINSKKTRKAVEIKVGSEGQELKGSSSKGVKSLNSRLLACAIRKKGILNR